MKKHLLVALLILTHGLVGSAAWLAAPESYETSVLAMKVVSTRCAKNGEGPDANLASSEFAGLANLKKVTRTGPISYTIVCANGAHFYDTMTWDLEKPKPKPEAPATGAG